MDALKKEGIHVENDVIANPSAANAYFVPIRLTDRSKEHKRPSENALRTARSRLLDLGYLIDFIFVDDESRNIEESLRASLISSFPHDVRNAYFSYIDGNPKIWIDFKRPLEEQVLNRLQNHLATFSDLFALPKTSYAALGDINTPTRIEILSTIRQLAPVSVSTLANALLGRSFTVPSTDWLNRRLDVLRKTHLVIRRKDGSYVVTMEALAKLGTRKGRGSPDVQRLLALARRDS